jgi:hypothetical protein
MEGEKMRKPFTIAGAILLLVVAAAHLYRAYAGIDIGVANQVMPGMWSWIIGGVLALVGLMMLVELRK